ncbi:hypothetical protein MKX07_004618 [Trichoderma sp. CBMAI-0711]|nr:hypothetical protein MKX07_004618 [Trichoderma sp. CBMAI-0711]
MSFPQRTAPRAHAQESNTGFVTQGVGSTVSTLCGIARVAQPLAPMGCEICANVLSLAVQCRLRLHRLALGVGRDMLERQRATWAPKQRMLPRRTWLRLDHSVAFASPLRMCVSQRDAT